MSAVENVYSLPINSVYKDITTFLRDQDSEHTRKNYERAIRYFFTYMRQGKRLEDLTVGDLKFRNADVKEYRLHLKDKCASAGTANLYLAALQSLYDFFERNYEGIRAASVKVDFLTYNPQSYGKLTVQEAEMMAELAKEELNGHEKYCLIRLAYTTSFRKETLLSLQWSDFKKHPTRPIYLITTDITKGEKEHTRPISEDLYGELLKIKESKRYQKYNDNKVFHFNNSTVQEMMDKLREKMGFTPEDKIVFHSLRSVMAVFAVETLKDYKMAKEQLNHSDINTTINSYTEAYDDYEAMPGVLVEQKVSDDVFDALTRDELLSLLKSQTNGVLLGLKIGAKKMLEEKMKVSEKEKETIG
jgi:integrase